jgi:hypothetical protein
VSAVFQNLQKVRFKIICWCHGCAGLGIACTKGFVHAEVYWLQWKKDHLVGHLFSGGGRCDHLQILDAPADGGAKLMRIVDARKRGARLLTFGRLDQKVVILRKEHASDFGRKVQESRIFHLAGTILGGSQYTSTPRSRNPLVMARGT